MTTNPKRQVIFSEEDLGVVRGIGIAEICGETTARRAICFTTDEIETIRRLLNKKRHKSIAFEMRDYAARAVKP